MNFSRWHHAKAYYNLCFANGSVVIRPPQVHTPIQNPPRKRQKVAASPTPTSSEYTSLSFPSSPSPKALPNSSHCITRRLARRRIVIVDDSSDENTNPQNGMKPAISLPRPNSSELIVERHTSPPKILSRTNSVVIVYDSEEDIRKQEEDTCLSPKVTEGTDAM